MLLGEEPRPPETIASISNTMPTGKHGNILAKEYQEENKIRNHAPTDEPQEEESRKTIPL
eukprot:snap_masked-scaffold_1-processed-gene-13.14-mRNA-1 protein AED:1.00 eAED:1.00 QI:0/-1/0/0/-1/1/1/0/59